MGPSTPNYRKRGHSNSEGSGTINPLSQQFNKIFAKDGELFELSQGSFGQSESVNSPIKFQKSKLKKVHVTAQAYQRIKRKNQKLKALLSKAYDNRRDDEAGISVKVNPVQATSTLRTLFDAFPSRFTFKDDSDGHDPNRTAYQKQCKCHCFCGKNTKDEVTTCADMFQCSFSQMSI